MNIIINDKVIISKVTIEDIYSAFEGLPEITWIPVILEDGDDYIQALANRRCGIVEARLYSGDSFRHYRGKTAEEDNRLMLCNEHTDQPITIRQKNVLSTQTMRILFTDFLNTSRISQCVIWEDVTMEFDSEYLVDKS